MVNLSRKVIPLLALAVAFAAAGCGGGSLAICEKMQECNGGNDADLDACLAETQGAAAVASAYDCADQYSKYADCLEAKGTCDNNRFTADCDDERDALQACQKAASALD